MGRQERRRPPAGACPALRGRRGCLRGPGTADRAGGGGRDRRGQGGGRLRAAGGGDAGRRAGEPGPWSLPALRRGQHSATGSDLLLELSRIFGGRRRDGRRVAALGGRGSGPDYPNGRATKARAYQEPAAITVKMAAMKR